MAADSGGNEALPGKSTSHGRGLAWQPESTPILIEGVHVALIALPGLLEWKRPSKTTRRTEMSAEG